jgi:hypothetical protein
MFRKSAFLVVCLAAVMLFISATESYASPARLGGLNMTGHRAGFVRDYTNTYMYPVAINRYPNMVWVHMGHSSPYEDRFEANHRVMGMFHEIGEDGQYGILGITLREDSPTDPILQYMELMGASHQQFDFMYGRDMEQASFGLRFDLARSSYENAEGNTRAPDEYDIGLDGHVNTWGIGAGVDVDINEDAMLEVGAEVRKYSFKDEGVLETVEDDGSMSFRANARVFWERSETRTMIPQVAISQNKIGEEDGLTNTWTDFYAGAACNHMVNGDDLLVYGAAFRMQTMKVENGTVVQDDTRRSVPVLFIALEHRFRDWLVGRGGASQAMVSDKDKSDDAGDETELYSDFDFALGIAMEFSNFTIDATLNQNYPFTGFWFVSGEETHDLFGMMSFTYTFD